MLVESFGAVVVVIALVLLHVRFEGLAVGEHLSGHLIGSLIRHPIGLEMLPDRLKNFGVSS